MYPRRATVILLSQLRALIFVKAPTLDCFDFQLENSATSSRDSSAERVNEYRIDNSVTCSVENSKCVCDGDADGMGMGHSMRLIIWMQFSL